MAREPIGRDDETRLNAQLVGKDVQPFALGSEALRPGARLAGLDRVGERLARRLRDVFEPFARVKPKVEAEGVADLAVRDVARCAARVHLAQPLPAAPDEGRHADRYHAGLCRPAGRCLLRRHGRQQCRRRASASSTAAEERLLSRLTDAIAAAVVEVWADIVPLEPSLASRETNAGYASLVRGDESVVVQRFSIAGGGPGATSIDLVFPLSAMRAYEAQLAAKIHAEAGPVDSEFRYRMARALQQVSLPVRSVVARPTLSVSELIALKVGDVIPITLAPRVPLIVGNRRLAEGTIGEQEGRAAFQVETIGAPDRTGGN